MTFLISSYLIVHVPIGHSNAQDILLSPKLLLYPMRQVIIQPIPLRKQLIFYNQLIKIYGEMK